MWLFFSSRIHNEYFQSHLLLLDTLKHKKESEREKKNLLNLCFSSWIPRRLGQENYSPLTAQQISTLSWTNRVILMSRKIAVVNTNWEVTYPRPSSVMTNAHCSSVSLAAIFGLLCPSGWWRGQTGWTWAVGLLVMNEFGHVGCWAIRCRASDKCLCLRF